MWLFRNNKIRFLLWFVIIDYKTYWWLSLLASEYSFRKLLVIQSLNLTWKLMFERVGFSSVTSFIIKGTHSTFLSPQQATVWPVVIKSSSNSSSFRAFEVSGSYLGIGLMWTSE